MEKNLGHATAYGYAKSKGYSGTEEEFAELMADYASVGQSAAESAEQAAASATSASGSATTASQAAQTATSKASEAVTAADTATTKASEASQSASTASAAATSAGTSAQTAITAATTATEKASEASESATTATTAKTDAETARDAAAQSASQAAESARTLTIDDTLTQSGQAADARVVGDKVADLKSALFINTDRSMIIDIDNLRENGKVVLSPVYINNVVQSQSGNIGNPSNIRVTTQNLIYVPKNAIITYKTTENYSLVMHTYDAERNYLGYSAFGQLPSNAYYFRPVFSYSNNADISASDVATNVMFTLTTDTTEEKIENAIEAYNTSAETKFIQKQIGKNLLNPSDVVVGYLKNDGDISSTATQYRTSNYIPVESGQNVTISPRTRIFAFYDSSKNMVSGSYMNTETQNYTGTASVDGYFRFSYYYADEDIQAEYGTTPTNYEPYMMVPEPIVGLSTMQKTQVNNMISGSGDFSSIRVGIFGDSIMHGAGNPQQTASDGYYGIGDILHERYGLSFDDRCVSGALVEFVEGRETKAVYQQVNEAITAQENYDLIIMDGLSNDIVHGTLGELTTSFDFLTNGYNDFTSALEYCFGKLKTAYPGVPILYVIPHSSNGRDYTNELNFGNRAREICKKWSIPIADVYLDGNMTARIPQQLQEFTNYPTETTGTHPNRAGYDYAYIPLIVAWMKNVFANMS